MRTSIAQIAAALALAAAPSLVNSPTIRISLLLPCFGAGLLLALRRSGPEGPTTPSLPERLKVQGESLSSLTERLKDVMRQTEQAILDINVRFMNIAGRARMQLTRNAETVRCSSAVHGTVTLAGAEGFVRSEPGSGSERQEMQDETAALTRDIHGIIEALQFEDIVRQQIGLVISDLQRLRKELAEMERTFAPSDRQVS